MFFRLINDTVVIRYPFLWNFARVIGAQPAWMIPSRMPNVWPLCYRSTASSFYKYDEPDLITPNSSLIHTFTPGWEKHCDAEVSFQRTEQIDTHQDLKQNPGLP